MKTLDQNEIERYNRHLILPGFELEHQEKIKNASALIVGVGGLGSPISLYLAAAGFGKIGLIDSDVVSETNLQRQVLYRQSQIGEFKAEKAMETLQDLNPYTEFESYNHKLDENNALSIIENYDIVLDGTDNFKARYIVDDATSYLGKPYVYGSISEYTGQISVMNFEDGPSYRMLYPEEADLDSERLIGVMGILPGIVGSMQANEAVKVITGLGSPLSGELMLINILENMFTKVKFFKDPSQISLNRYRK